jgi:hypothetical protein
MCGVTYRQFEHRLGASSARPKTEWHLLRQLLRRFVDYTNFEFVAWVGRANHLYLRAYMRHRSTRRKHSVLSRVMPGLSSTMAMFWRKKRLKSDDLPTFGRPTMAIIGNFLVSMDMLSMWLEDYFDG